MLFESISYQNGFPFELSFLNVAEESKHCHKEIEIVLVLRGVTHYQIYHTDYELNPGDLIIADVEDLHQIHHSSDDIIMLSIHVDTGYFETIYPNIRYMFFVCEECMEGPAGNAQLLQSKLALLKHRIAGLALEYMGKERDSHRLSAGINDLISILVNHFQGFFMEDYQYKTSPENLSSDDLHRLSRITRYIMLNYNKKISLEDVSEMEHLSSYYVSHLIKKNLGFNFQNFVNAIRLEYAEKLLVFSNLTLMQISQDCGFSSPNYFNKCFSAWHGKTPAQYRKDYVTCERSYKDGFSQEEAVSLLIPYLNSSSNDENYLPKSISITLNPDADVYEDFWENYAPKLIIRSQQDLMDLGYYDHQIRQIRPASFIADEEFLTHNKTFGTGIQRLLSHFQIPLESQFHLASPDGLATASSAAGAASHILKSRSHAFFPFGKGNCLFTAEGLITPIYWFYTFFTGLQNPKICVREDYALVKTDDSFLVFLYNTSPHFSLSAQFSFPPDLGPFYLRKTELSEKDNCYSILSDLEDPKDMPSLLKDRINQSLHGKTRFYTKPHPLDEMPDFMVYHNTVTILELISM